MAEMVRFQKQLEEQKKKLEDQIKEIKYERNKKNKKLTDEELQKFLPRIKTKQEIYEDLKHKLKHAWKDPGYKNDEFNKVPILKANTLSSWQISRIPMAERSYKAPPGFKGFKVPVVQNEFGNTGFKELPEQFANYLQKVEEKFIDFQFRPSKYGKIDWDQKLETIKLMNKQPFQKTNTVQYKEFGFDTHATFEREAFKQLSATHQKKNSFSLTKN